MVAAPLEQHHEADLVARAQRGDSRALDQLLRAHRPRIVSICRRVTNSESDAQDAAQDACIAIMRHIGRFDGKSSFGTWVYRVATNASLDELRRRNRRPIASDLDSVVGDTPSSAMNALLDTAAGSARAHSLSTGAAGAGSSDAGFDERIADRLQVDAALAALPEEFRSAVVLRDLCDLDYTEIAQVLGVPIGTVRSRIARGRAALARGIPNPAEPMPGEKPVTSEPGNQPAPPRRLSAVPVDSVANPANPCNPSKP